MRRWLPPLVGLLLVGIYLSFSVVKRDPNVAGDALSPEGMSGYAIGMKRDGKGSACEEVIAPDGTRLMYENDILTRITLVSGSAHKTREGVAVGDSEVALNKNYQYALSMLPHKYDEKGHYFKTRPQDNRGYVFETDGKQVVKIHAGLYPAVAYVEGCL